MISKEDVKKLSVLSRVGVSGREVESLRKDLEKMLEFVSRLKQAPETAEESAGHRNVLRNDADPHESALYSDPILKEAPKTEDGFIKVRKVL